MDSNCAFTFYLLCTGHIIWRMLSQVFGRYYWYFTVHYFGRQHNFVVVVASCIRWC